MTHLAAIARLVAHVEKEERRDGDLLSAFLHRRDETAFAELIRRHGPMVWGVCRRSLPDAADAEDAFQAAFLVLVRKARQLTRQTTVGPWLYRVAAWTSRNLRRKNARRLSRTVPLADVANVPPREPDYDLDTALLALPEKYRTPLVLCHLIGLSRREAALHLGCPEGTLSARLSRALAKLRVKLLGQDPLPMLAIVSGGIVPASLATATERTAVAFVLSSMIPSASSPAAMLAEGVLRMFWIKKAATTAVAAMVMMAAGRAMIGIVAMQGNGKAIANPQGQQDQLQKEVMEKQKLIAQQKANLEILRSQDKHLQEEIKNAEIDLTHQLSILDQLTRKAGANTPEVKTDDPKKPGKTNFDRFLFVRAYSHTAMFGIEELSPDAKLHSNGKSFSRFLEMQRAYIPNPAIPVELKIAGYRNPEHQLEYLRLRLKELPQWLKEDPKIKDEIIVTETKIKEIEKWKSSKPDIGPFTVCEHKTLDDKGLTSNCWDEAALTKHLNRIHRDEKAQKEIMIVVSENAPPERLTKALKAAYDAGFKGGRIFLQPEIGFTLSGSVLRTEGDLKLLECKTEDFSKLTVTPKK